MKFDFFKEHTPPLIGVDISSASVKMVELSGDGAGRIQDANLAMLVVVHRIGRQRSAFARRPPMRAGRAGARSRIVVGRRGSARQRQQYGQRAAQNGLLVTMGMGGMRHGHESMGT